MIESYKSQRSKEVSPATVNRELVLLKNMFTMAIKWKCADSNPVDALDAVFGKKKDSVNNKNVDKIIDENIRTVRIAYMMSKN